MEKVKYKDIIIEEDGKEIDARAVYCPYCWQYINDYEYGILFNDADNTVECNNCDRIFSIER